MRIRPGRVVKPLALVVEMGTLAAAVSGVSVFIDWWPWYYPSVAYRAFVLGSAFSFFVFPGISSFIARRRYFLWGFVTAAIAGLETWLIGWLQMKAYEAFWRPPGFGYVGPAPGGFEPLLIVYMTLLGVSVSSGSVSLIRYVIQRRHDLVNVPDDVTLVDREVKEGAWPPPPAVK